MIIHRELYTIIYIIYIRIYTNYTAISTRKSSIALLNSVLSICLSVALPGCLLLLLFVAACRMQCLCGICLVCSVNAMLFNICFSQIWYGKMCKFYFFKNWLPQEIQHEMAILIIKMMGGWGMSYRVEWHGMTGIWQKDWQIIMTLESLWIPWNYQILKW